MSLTFGDFRKICAPYAGRSGKCASSAEVAVFARQVMENLLYSGSTEAVRKVCILAYRGCLTLPPEVEVPIKVKIDRKFSNLWSKWLTYHTDDNCWKRSFRAEEIMQEDGSYSPLQYNLPEGGSVVGILANCDEDKDATVIIQGKDVTGKEIYTYFNGEQITGEKFLLKKGEVRFGKVTFGQVTGVIKPKTNGYVSLFAVNEITEKIIHFLADYSPSEERPMYRVFRIVSQKCDPIVHLSILCRVRIKDNYHDNELTLFDNSIAVLFAAQRLQSEVNYDSANANYKNQALEDILQKEAGYKKVTSGPMDVFFPLSGGAIRRIY